MDEIQIRTLEDIRLKVPKEARTAFVTDLLEWLAWHDKGGGAEVMCRNLEEWANKLGVKADSQVFDPTLMTWVNDGKKGISGVEIQIVNNTQ